jgi:hypothetical protein
MKIKHNAENQNPLFNNLLENDYQIPFQELKVEHFLPALRYYVSLAKTRLDRNYRHPDLLQRH